MQRKYPARRSRTYATIERSASRVRKKFGFDLAGKLPGVQLFERLNYHSVNLRGRQIPVDFAVESLRPGVEAEARMGEEGQQLVVALTPETYQGLERDWPRSRFSLFHELGHVFLHPQELEDLRSSRLRVEALQRGDFQDLKPFQDVEWQANAFAAALSMPAIGLARLERRGELSEERLMEVFGASSASARIRLRVYRERKDQLLSAQRIRRGPQR